MMSFMAEPQVWTSDLLEAPHDVSDKAGRVRRMFNAIAPRYERVNSLFSAGRDRYWRRKAVAQTRVRADDDVLDVACGTGDFARAFRAAGPRSVVGCDFAHEMLLRAANRKERRRLPGGDRWIEADALQLSFRDGSFSIVSCAFGVRNFADLQAGLLEMHRVLRPGGRVVILEFTRPGNALMRSLYEFYANRVMPFAAAWVSRDASGAYRYLPRSVVSFLDAPRMIAELHRAGFERATATPLTFGIVTVYLGFRG